MGGTRRDSFEARLGITIAEAGLLKAALLDAAQRVEAVPSRRNDFGQLYEVRFPLAGPIATAMILSVWIMEDASPDPRLVTCYPV